MTIFCTNCGHSNEKENKICVECGQPLVVQNAAPAKNKTPMPLKTKVVGAIIVLFLAGLGGVYSWGTKTASPETTVSKFFEALEKKDATMLAQQMALSNGEPVETKQASAFMKLYSAITPSELEQVAAVGESGKLFGIFTTHKIIFPEQTAFFEFPHEGLKLRLNGEKVETVYEESGIYRFSGLVPGNYEAEFIYDGDYTEFTHPFDLTLSLGNASEETAIYEELPAESVVLNFDVFNEANFKEYKVRIGDKEFPIDATGKTERIGPLPLDGTYTAQGERTFSWGTQISEPMKITEDFQTLEISKLPKKEEDKLIEQLMLFAEQYTQALATRDVSVLKTVSADQQKVFEKQFTEMKNNNTYFKGSFQEMNVDMPSIALSTSGEAVEVFAEMEYSGAYYGKGEMVSMDTIAQAANVSFIYDTDVKKWMVNDYETDLWSWSFDPTKTIKGSKKVYEIAGSAGKQQQVQATEPVEIAEETSGISNTAVEAFFSQYNDNSVAAINTGNFGLVSSMITLEGPRFQEQSDFIDSLYVKGITEEHLGTSLEKVEVVDDHFIQVTTIEKFIIHGTEKSSEKKYRTVTLVEVIDQNFYVHKLISTKEI